MTGQIQPGPTLMPGDPRYEDLARDLATLVADPGIAFDLDKLPPSIHPLANWLPMLPDDQRIQLRGSLDEKQNHPVVFHRGRLLDGRNRSRELIELRKPIASVVFVGNDWEAVRFVRAENVERRHLTESQRADFAARVAKLPVGANQHTMGAQICAPSLPMGEAPEPVAAPPPVMTQTEAAQEFSVSRRSVQHAATVHEKGTPELQAALRDGKIAVSAAADIAALPIEDQRKIIAAADPKVVKEVSKKNRADKQTKSREKRLANMAKAGDLTLIEDKKYSVHLIDVPREFVSWSADTGAEKSPENHYRVEAFEYLAGLRDKLLASSAPNCAVFMWAWANSLQDQLDLLAEFGFAAVRRRDENGRLLRGPDGKILAPVGEGRYRTHQIWAKRNPDGTLHRGTGFWFIDGHELLLLGIRGDVPAPLMGSQERSLLDLPIGEHSEKPSDAIRAMIDRYFPGVAKLEWFARVPDLTAFKAKWPEWDVTGNEAFPQQQSLLPAAVE